MQDFKKANAAAQEAQQGATKVVEYLGDIKELLAAVDEAEGVKEEREYNGERFVMIPAAVWDDVTRAYQRAW